MHGPVCLGESRLHRIVADFQDRHPAVSVRLTLENRSADLIHEGFDLAIRMGRPVDQEAILRRIGLVQRILVAAPSYLAKRASVTEPHDLPDHSLLVTDTVLSRADTLPLCRNGETVEVPVRPVLTTNNARVLIDAMLSGRGIGTAQVQLVAEELASGASGAGSRRSRDPADRALPHLFLGEVPAADGARLRRFRRPGPAPDRRYRLIAEKNDLSPAAAPGSPRHG